MSVKTFEKSLEDLEKLVIQLEKGDLNLDKAIELYKKGIILTQYCDNELKTAKLKIEELKLDPNHEN